MSDNREIDNRDCWDRADDIAEKFSELHPSVVMNLEQWRGLKELIATEMLALSIQVVDAKGGSTP